MGLFSKKPKPPKSAGKALPGDTHSTTSFSDHEALKSPISATARNINRASGGTATSSVPSTPLTPFSPMVPRVDMPKAPDPNLDPAAYLRSLGSVRERSKLVTEKALKNSLAHFDVDMDRFPDVVSFVCGIIKRDYDAPFSSIPSHGRYQHFSVGGRDRIQNLMSTFSDSIDTTEKCRRLIDLFLVSVLLDAGAGTSWSFKSAENGRVYKRSEGLAIASLEMFKAGLFSGNSSNKFQVDKNGLRSLTVAQLAKGVQSRPGSELAGLEGRAELLVKLGHALDQKKEYFGDNGRPGNMIDYLLSHPTTQASSMPIVVLPVLWNLLMTGLAPIWPSSRTAIDGVSLGDAWPCSSMPQPATLPSSPSFSPFPNSQPPTAPWESILPFHKLTQWLTYSLMQPMQSLLKIHFAGAEMLTGLPEYRNGGLFVDLGVLTLKKDDLDRGLQYYKDYCVRKETKGVEVAPMFEPSDDVIVEWRGVTVGFLDKLLVDVNRALHKELNGGELTLPQLLEAGSWKGGREIAEVSRPNTKEPPILLDSDGTVF
ncbi:hypothetical protein JX265_011593 [Neoarthrinium moseri]|uniref:Uracil catabolism protein 4 n=1 Tax=Neoarthrinium moseri TaxID=1658444 RepID=A0A9P9WC52_9PEZI|nr:uncharacterized protein JN550_013628 [Neoarthrinium moseri]KAI1848553.1 hypothetical protein JX266_005412 [Neoarthrinium moseri]KAI1856634.1 hypothetical protein JX265_011593 [Neoarthrinium moseri]KAI1856883.1 hypothetical protein JN550_013628 [Neoarthrinium moseri]